MAQLMIKYLDSIKHFLYVVAISVQGFPRGSEEGDGLGALLHQCHTCGSCQASPLKEIKDVADEKQSNNY